MYQSDLSEPRRLSARDDDSSAASSRSKFSLEGDAEAVDLKPKPIGAAPEAERSGEDSSRDSGGRRTWYFEEGKNAPTATGCSESERSSEEDLSEEDSTTSLYIDSLQENLLSEQSDSVSAKNCISNEDEKSSVSTPSGEGLTKVPPVEAFAFSGNVDAEEKDRLDGTYEVNIPVTPFGLLLKLREWNGVVTFDGYAKCPDGSKGPSELENLIRRNGDVIVAIDGTNMHGLTYREVVDMVKEMLSMKESSEEKQEFLSVRFMDSKEWLGRQNSVDGGSKQDAASQSMALNVAYESLEIMRKANLEVEFGACVDFDGCTQCLRLRTQNSHRVGHRLKRMASRRWRPNPCLLCASPVCAQHSMESFRKEKITVCCDCSPLFTHDFIVDILDITVNEKNRKKQIDHMVDVYDRAVLMLKYSSQYVDSIASVLEHNTKRNDKVGLGSSATGLVSGVTGVVGAATILTPVGPPLLIASLFFGGSATAVQTGSEAVNYFSEPNKLADKIIALHAIVVSLLELVNVLQNALLKEQVRVDQFLEKDSGGQKSPEAQKMTRNAGVASIKYAGAASGAAAAARAGVVVGRNSRFVTRASTTAMRTARFARFAGGALSAATVVMEAREMSSAMKRIRHGNPCEKADLIRCIKSDLSELPETSVIAEECESYFAAMTSRPVASAALVRKQKEVDILDALELLEHSTRTLDTSIDLSENLTAESPPPEEAITG